MEREISKINAILDAIAISNQTNTEIDPDKHSKMAKEANAKQKANEDDEDLFCVTCLTMPKGCKVFGCQNCDAMICEGCAQDVNHCPVCRVEFKTLPLIRSHILEKMITKMY